MTGIFLDDIKEFLNRFLGVDRFPNDPSGIYRPSQRPIQRLGLALEPGLGLAGWVETEGLDALFLHRPWKLEPAQIPADMGVLAYHLAFDERFTLGFNPRLAEVLDLSGLEVLGEKEGRAIGMLGNVPQQRFNLYGDRIKEIFGGCDAVIGGEEDKIDRVAVVGVMTDALVREANQRGVDVYITGQFRQPAKQAVSDTGIKVIAIGHRRSEEWGLRSLAGVLCDRWYNLEVIVEKPQINLPPFVRGDRGGYADEFL